METENLVGGDVLTVLLVRHRVITCAAQEFTVVLDVSA